MASGLSSIQVGRTANGFCMRIIGKGTMNESPAASAFAHRTLEAQDGVLTLDVLSCDYLDSTFLGCLITLNKEFGTTSPARFVVACDEHHCKELFTSFRLDRVLKFIDAPPDVIGGTVPLKVHVTDPVGVAKHVMECHRNLAELGGPSAAACRVIADRLESELTGAKI